MYLQFAKNTYSDKRQLARNSTTRSATRSLSRLSNATWTLSRFATPSERKDQRVTRSEIGSPLLRRPRVLTSFELVRPSIGTSLALGTLGAHLFAASPVVPSLSMSNLSCQRGPPSQSRRESTGIGAVIV